MQRLPRKSFQAGFTLIELMVTTVITTILLLTASTILMTFFLTNSRTAVRRQIKTEGARALDRIEFVARAAQDCTDTNGVSNTTGSDITFTNTDGTTTEFKTALKDGVNNLVMINQPANTEEYLISNFSVAMTDGQFLLACVQESGTNKKYANIRFNLTNLSTTITENFTTLTVLRNSQ